MEKQGATWGVVSVLQLLMNKGLQPPEGDNAHRINATHFAANAPFKALRAEHRWDASARVRLSRAVSRVWIVVAVIRGGRNI
jgi:hypothetical protein